MSSKSKLSLTFLDRLPRSAAAALQELAPEEASEFLETVPARIAAPVLSEMIPWNAARQLELIPAARAALVLRELSFADTTTLARLMRPEARTPIFEELPTRFAARLGASLRYPSHQVGAWIDPQVPTLSTDNNAADALRVLRSADPTSHVLVEEPSHGPYVGTVAVRDVLRALPNTPLNELRIAKTTPLSNRASLASVAFDARWDEFVYLPVVGRRGNLLGGLSRRALREATHDHAHATGSHDHTILYHMVNALLLTCSALGALLISPTSARSTLERGTPTHER